MHSHLLRTLSDVQGYNTFITCRDITTIHTLEICEMAKWKSPIFSDIRNKLGENVVFSMWKGRPYMRSYVVPANPQSDAQTANRAHMAAILGLYQTNIKGTPANATAWDAEALPKLISGYNLFMQYGRTGAQTETAGRKDPGIIITSLAAGSLDINVVASAIPADRLSLMTVSAAGVPIEIATKRGTGHYVPGSWSTAPVATDLIYVVDTQVLVGADVETTAAIYKAVNHWVPDESAGTLTPMVVTA